MPLPFSSRLDIIHNMNRFTTPLPRLLEPAITAALQRFPVVVLTGARQTGKTSLLVRGADHARKRGAQVVYLDFQQAFDRSQLSDLDTFLMCLAYALAGQARAIF